MKRVAWKLGLLTTGLLGLLAGCSGGSTGGTDSSGSTGSGSTGGSTTGGTSGSSGGTTGTPGNRFALAIEPSALAIHAGDGGVISTLLTRDLAGGLFGDAVTLSVEGISPDAGLHASFDPNPTTRALSLLTVTADYNAPSGDYALTVLAVAGSEQHTAPLSVSVTANGAPGGDVLLVDHDNSSNNTGSDTSLSGSDKAYDGLLRDAGLAHDTVAPPDDNSVNLPQLGQLERYHTVVWYSGRSYSSSNSQGTVSTTNQAALGPWLDEGNHKLMLFTQLLMYDLGGDSAARWTNLGSPFLSRYAGIVGGIDPYYTSNEETYGGPYWATGVDGGVLKGLSIYVSEAVVGNEGGMANAGPGTDVLATVIADPDGKGNRPIPIITGRKHVGDAGSSTVIYSGIPLENVVVDGGSASARTVFQKLLSY